jgi:hypothetical protein
MSVPFITYELYSKLIKGLEDYMSLLSKKYDTLENWANINKDLQPDLVKQIEDAKDVVDDELVNIGERISQAEYARDRLISSDPMDMLRKLEKDITRTQTQPSSEIKVDTDKQDKLFTNKSDEELLIYCNKLEDEFDNLTEAVDHQNEPEKSILLMSIEKLQLRVNEDINRIRTFLNVKNVTDYYFIQSQEHDGGSLSAVESLLSTLVIDK